MKPETMIKHNLTARDVLVLSRIGKDKNQTLTSLACRLVSKVSASSIVDKLVKLEYAKRTRNKDDRRVVNVTLTSTGKKLIQV